ncbi:Protein CBG00206 [Caenorhabditis briggsae]|uniref:Protein CBG00206 n=1 Tax=Caenorhabditis briggsae TaxID=6238 RepID=A8WMH0_CAEBR|nr:Protein CBG00206 [Caenorhabditis briggsae]CAP21675.1 Protein CBG00206 [Caenorhabditis briggsae]
MDDVGDLDRFPNNFKFEEVVENESIPQSDVQMREIEFKCFALLGKGGYGKVYLAYVHGRTKYYAIKEVRKDIIVSKNKLKYVKNEFHVFKQLDSVFFPKFYAAFTNEKYLMFVMENVEGGSMRQLLERQGRLDQHEAKFYAAELFVGICYLHDNNIAHRDLKCENLLLTANGHLKICDFGLAKPNMTENTLCTEFCGTLLMLAPEVLQGLAYTRSTDWYAFGLILAEMFIGRSPMFLGDRKSTKQFIIEMPFDKLALPEMPFFAKNLANKLVTDRRKRLKPEQIANDQFFVGTDWNNVRLQLIPPPFGRNKFIQETRVLISGKGNEVGIVSESKQNLFEEFDYNVPGEFQ